MTWKENPKEVLNKLQEVVFEEAQKYQCPKVIIQTGNSMTIHIGNKAGDLNIDEPVMINFSECLSWELYYYAGEGRVWCGSHKSGFWRNNFACTISPLHIVPYSFFKPNDIDKSLKYDIKKDMVL